MPDRRKASIIIDADTMRKGVRSLRRKCPHIRHIHDLTGDPPLRDYRPGFAGLARIVVGQQVSLAAAQAIWGRLELASAPVVTPQTFLLLNDDDLRQVGLSRGKVKTLRGIATAIADGFDLDALSRKPEDELHATLTALPGVGPWSAEIYMLFCLGRADAFAAGDLALQISACAALGLENRPNRDELLTIAERWKPWRGVAAHLLWAYYKVADRTLLKKKHS
ncbi:DNA-3-methyladenine glycosylase II [Hyphomicrobium sulfonivorans]|uniref:DNA-3-methyladenine glycosylase II n=1 Tax=Hyphomicrobium sulfonivorans TaxID=121290 RepID=A0A125NUC8_HYPSL|nr:DNA-3-methyladenine glycosylase [Hyphomicrobium sulfonivorans]KWT66239.1 DNA-3-methyladenine glycosylase II [Hyphomicrobium sulfonivorans]